MEKKINVPIENDSVSDLRIGDVISLTGNILTARDQAHKRLIEQGAPLDIEGAVLFHAGPIISEENGKYKMVAIGPTTSMRRGFSGGLIFKNLDLCPTASKIVKKLPSGLFAFSAGHINAALLNLSLM